MDATWGVACNKELFNPVLTMGMQVSFILVVSHCFQLVLKPLHQPAPIAQILMAASCSKSTNEMLGSLNLPVGVIETTLAEEEQNSKCRYRNLP